MLGKIKTISKNGAVVEVDTSTTTAKDLINLHVVFEDENKKILGEIESILEDTVKISFLGELTEDDFIGGLIKKPSLDATVRIINEQELKIIDYYAKRMEDSFYKTSEMMTKLQEKT
jgi:hypothetical protein